MSFDGWRCSLEILGICIDTSCDPGSSPIIPSTLEVCPRCSLQKSLNARDTFGLMFDTTSLVPFILPRLSHIMPLADLVTQYLRIQGRFEAGDCVDLPDLRGLVRRAVVLEAMKLLPTTAGFAPSLWFMSASGLQVREGEDIEVVLVRFLGCPPVYDTIIQSEACRPSNRPPFETKQDGIASLLDPRCSWEDDERWSRNSKFAYWRRNLHTHLIKSNFVREVLTAEGHVSLLVKS
jgi:hypothetical protein